MRRIEQLQSLLREMGSCLVAYSGGVDSTFLLAVARNTLGDRHLAVTVHTLLHDEEEIADARRRAADLSARHKVMTIDVEGEEAVLRNPPDRCYHCKKAIFTALADRAAAEGLENLVEASHRDDLGERRPGIRALQDLSVRSPLLEAGFTKEEIRAASEILGIEGSRRHSRPCLATRIPYGIPLTGDRLRRVSEAEKVLTNLGFSAPRVRDHGDSARIELRPGEMERAAAQKVRDGIARALRDLGYTYITLDLMGYRSGSMNEILESQDRRR